MRHFDAVEIHKCLLECSNFLRAFVPYARGVTLGGWCVCSRGKVWTGLKSLFSPHLSLLLHIYVHLLDHAGNTEHKRPVCLEQREGLDWFVFI